MIIRREVKPSTDGSDEPLWITVKQACARLNVGRTKLYEMMDEDPPLPSFKRGGLRRIPVAAFNEWARRQQGQEDK